MERRAGLEDLVVSRPARADGRAFARDEFERAPADAERAEGRALERDDCVRARVGEGLRLAMSAG